jgi:hypothetical protein
MYSGGIYQAYVIGDRLRQGQILHAVPSLHLDEESKAALITYPHAVLLSQDCDLEQDFNSTTEGKPPVLENALLCRAVPIEEVQAVFRERNQSDLFRRVKQNQDERYQSLTAVTTDDAELCPPLVIDFRNYFTVSLSSLYSRMSVGRTTSICALNSPWAEKLSVRFASYLSRIALPTDHRV